MMFKKETIAEGVELFLGDCREVMASFPPCFRVDAVVTDPPYGVGEGYASFDDTQDNLRLLIASTIPRLREIASRVIVTSGNQHQWEYPKPTWTMAWTTPAGAGSGPWGFSCWQPILCYGKDPLLSSGKGRRPDLIEHTETSEKNGHPCPKPIRFMERLLERTTLPGEVVLDPFMGSGTTGVAAIRQGRKFMGVELDPTYFEIACRRISDALSQQDMFVGKPAPKARQETLEL